MVSSSLGMSLQELIDSLQRIARESADDPEYTKLRAALPDEFPF